MKQYYHFFTFQFLCQNFALQGALHQTPHSEQLFFQSSVESLLKLYLSSRKQDANTVCMLFYRSEVDCLKPILVSLIQSVWFGHLCSWLVSWYTFCYNNSVIPALNPSSGKMVQQDLVVDHMNAHYKKLLNAKCKYSYM